MGLGVLVRSARNPGEIAAANPVHSAASPLVEQDIAVPDFHALSTECILGYSARNRTNYSELEVPAAQSGSAVQIRDRVAQALGTGSGSCTCWAGPECLACFGNRLCLAAGQTTAAAAAAVAAAAAAAAAAVVAPAQGHASVVTAAAAAAWSSTAAGRSGPPARCPTGSAQTDHLPVAHRKNPVPETEGIAADLAAAPAAAAFVGTGAAAQATEPSAAAVTAKAAAAAAAAEVLGATAALIQRTATIAAGAVSGFL
mmetsp:Transcript_53650/g.125857  ORF Transcript_53650/g.125857 Transcript_53650/m.125857 type:complete len:256 (-) Transcript_53650:396-1163(-)